MFLFNTCLETFLNLYTYFKNYIKRPLLHKEYEKEKTSLKCMYKRFKTFSLISYFALLAIWYLNTFHFMENVKDFLLKIL